MKAKGRIVNIKRYPSEGISFLTITIGGIKRFEIDDFLELRPFKTCGGKGRLPMIDLLGREREVLSSPARGQVA
jgi:hypothetical protein